MSACASRRGPDGAIGFEILAGGGLGRTPIIGKVIREFLPQADLLAYLEAILRVYNRHGRRDNIHKARIKILVRALGVEEFTRQVEHEFEASARIRAAPARGARSRAHARDSSRRRLTRRCRTACAGCGRYRRFAARAPYDAWLRYNTRGAQGRRLSHRIRVAEEAWRGARRHQRPIRWMRWRQLADRVQLRLVRTTHDQNLVLADVPQRALREVWQTLERWSWRPRISAR